MIEHHLREFAIAILDGGLNRRLVDRTAVVIEEAILDRPMNKKQAAAFLGLSVSGFELLRKRGHIKGHRLPGSKRIYYFPSDLLPWKAYRTRTDGRTP